MLTWRALSRRLDKTTAQEEMTQLRKRLKELAELMPTLKDSAAAEGDDDGEDATTAAAAVNGDGKRRDSLQDWIVSKARRGPNDI